MDAEGCVEYTGSEDFRGRADIVRVKVSSDVIGIGEDAFASCVNLAEVDLGNVQVIGKRAFADCASLKRVRLPSTAREVRHRAFWRCRALRNVELPEGLRTVGSSSFERCVALESVEIPSTVATIGGLAFVSCNTLREVVLREGLKKIQSGAFMECRSLVRVALPSTLVVIRAKGFHSCNALRNVTLPEGLREIGNRAFENCLLLEGVVIPSTVTSIGEGAYWHCPSLKSVEFRDGILRFGRAFQMRSIRVSSPAFNVTTTNFPTRNGLGCILHRSPTVSDADLVISRKIFKTMSPGQLSDVHNRINEILRRSDETKEGKFRLIRDLIVSIELVHATTILELAIRKAGKDSHEHRNMEVIIIKGVLLFFKDENGWVLP